MITRRHHNCWTLINLSANPGSNMHIQLPPRHQGIDRNLKLIWVTWDLFTKVCKSLDNCFFSSECRFDLSRVVCGETRICSSAPPVCQYIWMFTLSVDLQLFRYKMSTWRLCQSLQAAMRQLSTPPPPPCLLSTLWDFKIAATKVFLQLD